jgi:hypothetical protein
LRRASVAWRCALHSQKSAPHGNFGAIAFGLRGEGANQARAFDDQIRAIERDGGGAAIGEHLEAINFVDDGRFSLRAEQIAHAVGDDECARGGIELLGLLEELNAQAAAREKRSGEETGGGTAYDSDALGSGRNSPATRAAGCSQFACLAKQRNLPAPLF